MIGSRECYRNLSLRYRRRFQILKYIRGNDTLHGRRSPYLILVARKFSLIMLNWCLPEKHERVFRYCFLSHVSRESISYTTAKAFLPIRQISGIRSNNVPAGGPFGADAVTFQKAAWTAHFCANLTFLGEKCFEVCAPRLPDCSKNLYEASCWKRRTSINAWHVRTFDRSGS
jgi:hypothetical protein